MWWETMQLGTELKRLKINLHRRKGDETYADGANLPMLLVKIYTETHARVCSSRVWLCVATGLNIEVHHLMPFDRKAAAG